MRTSAIRHPENHYFIIRRDWQLRALEIEVVGPKRGNSVECAAELMSVLEFHYNNRHANKRLKEFVEKAIAAKGKRLPPLGDWMPYSYRYIEELLLNGRSQNVVIQAIDLLVLKGFVSASPPPDIVDAYGGSTTWLKLNVDEINAWIEANMPKSWLEIASPERPQLGKGPRAEKERKGDAIAKNMQILGDFYRHIHGKNAAFALDEPRKKKITLRLKEGRTLGQGAQAIIGNLMSDFHQARHKENLKEDGGKVYDDIGDHIFGSAKKFEAHIGYAEDRGITEEIALAELQSVLSGQPSRYAKKGLKPSVIKQNEQVRASGEPIRHEKRYREFAFQIAAFFTTNVPAQDILEICQTQNGLIETGKDLVLTGFLADSIRDATRTFRPEGLTDEMETELNKFAKTFCQLQSLNSSE